MDFIAIFGLTLCTQIMRGGNQIVCPFSPHNASVFYFTNTVCTHMKTMIDDSIPLNPGEVLPSAVSQSTVHPSTMIIDEIDVTAVSSKNTQPNVLLPATCPSPHELTMNDECFSTPRQSPDLLALCLAGTTAGSSTTASNTDGTTAGLYTANPFPFLTPPRCNPPSMVDNVENSTAIEAASSPNMKQYPKILMKVGERHIDGEKCFKILLKLAIVNGGFSNTIAFGKKTAFLNGLFEIVFERGTGELKE